MKSKSEGSHLKMTKPSEDATWQFLAKHAIKVQLPAHQILLYTLQRPLMVSQLQCFPFSLKSRTNITELNKAQPY